MHNNADRKSAFVLHELHCKTFPLNFKYFILIPYATWSARYCEFYARTALNSANP